jgi:hypothetical protein
MVDEFGRIGFAIAIASAATPRCLRLVASRVPAAAPSASALLPEHPHIFADDAKLRSLLSVFLPSVELEPAFDE